MFESMKIHLSKISYITLKCEKQIKIHASITEQNCGYNNRKKCRQMSTTEHVQKNSNENTHIKSV